MYFALFVNLQDLLAWLALFYFNFHEPVINYQENAISAKKKTQSVSDNCQNLT